MSPVYRSSSTAGSHAPAPSSAAEQFPDRSAQPLRERIERYLAFDEHASGEEGHADLAQQRLRLMRNHRDQKRTIEQRRHDLLKALASDGEPSRPVLRGRRSSLDKLGTLLNKQQRLYRELETLELRRAKHPDELAKLEGELARAEHQQRFVANLQQPFDQARQALESLRGHCNLQFQARSGLESAVLASLRSSFGSEVLDRLGETAVSNLVRAIAQRLIGEATQAGGSAEARNASRMLLDELNALITDALPLDALGQAPRAWAQHVLPMGVQPVVGVAVYHAILNLQAKDCASQIRMLQTDDGPAVRVGPKVPLGIVYRHLLPEMGQFMVSCWRASAPGQRDVSVGLDAEYLKHAWDVPFSNAGDRVCEFTLIEGAQGFNDLCGSRGRAWAMAGMGLFLLVAMATLLFSIRRTRRQETKARQSAGIDQAARALSGTLAEGREIRRLKEKNRAVRNDLAAFGHRAANLPESLAEQGAAIVDLVDTPVSDLSEDSLLFLDELSERIAAEERNLVAEAFKQMNLPGRDRLETGIVRLRAALSELREKAARDSESRESVREKIKGVSAEILKQETRVESEQQQVLSAVRKEVARVKGLEMQLEALGGELRAHDQDFQRQLRELEDEIGNLAAERARRQQARQALFADREVLDALAPLMTAQAFERAQQRHIAITPENLAQRIDTGRFANWAGEEVAAPAFRASAYDSLVHLLFATEQAHARYWLETASGRPRALEFVVEHPRRVGHAVNLDGNGMPVERAVFQSKVSFEVGADAVARVSHIHPL